VLARRGRARIKSGFPGYPGGVLRKMLTRMAAHAETDREDGVEVVVLDFPRDLPFALKSNYPEFPDSCLPTGKLTKIGLPP
jgi:hypothetical protein